MSKSSKRTIKIFSLLAIIFLSGCISDDEIPIPKPFAYFRIDLPEKDYQLFQDNCPYSFEYPSAYSIVLPDSELHSEPCWKNIYYPAFKAELNLSYKKISTDSAGTLEKYLEDSWSLATKHQVKASGMPELPVVRDSARVYGLLFEIEGNAASSVQFYVTDSVNHFLRGALYFFARPNYDSLAPVIDFLKADVQHMLATLRWESKVAENQSISTKKGR